jgi:hypothetical protein
MTCYFSSAFNSTGTDTEEVHLGYDAETAKLTWSRGGDTLVFNPNDIVPRLALSPLLFEAKKKFRKVVLVDDYAFDNAHADLLRSHYFTSVTVSPQCGSVSGIS